MYDHIHHISITVIMEFENFYLGK